MNRDCLLFDRLIICNILISKYCWGWRNGIYKKYATYAWNV